MPRFVWLGYGGGYKTWPIAVKNYHAIVSNGPLESPPAFDFIAYNAQVFGSVQKGPVMS